MTQEQNIEVAENPETNVQHEFEQGLRLLEAVFFASPDPLSFKVLAERLTDEQEAVLPDMLAMLKSRYDGRGVHLVERDGLWAFRTAEDLSGQLDIHRDVTKKLSRPALETLSIVAYHQPVTRAEIESIRGVATSKGTLDILMEAGWVKPGRRRQVPGRPLTWITSSHFLDHFGLEDLNDLPGVDDLKAAGLLDKRPAIESVDMFEQMEEDDLQEELNLNEDDDNSDEF